MCPEGKGTFREIVEKHPSLSFAELVDALLIAKEIKISTLANQTGYDRKTITRICQNECMPHKKTVLTMGVAFGLNLVEMYYFLFKTGYTLCPTIPLDSIYIRVIQKVGGSGKKRIDKCIEELKTNGVKKKNLLWGDTKN